MKNAPKWVKKDNQDNIEANYGTQGDMKEGAKETTRRRLMSYWQRIDRASKQR